MSDCEKCGRWGGGDVDTEDYEKSVYWCSRLGDIPVSERKTPCPFFYYRKPDKE